MVYLARDGQKLPITNMFDCFGRATENPCDAFMLVAMLPDGNWLATECDRSDILDEALNAN